MLWRNVVHEVWLKMHWHQMHYTSWSFIRSKAHGSEVGMLRVHCHLMERWSLESTSDSCTPCFSITRVCLCTSSGAMQSSNLVCSCIYEPHEQPLVVVVVVALSLIRMVHRFPLIQRGSVERERTTIVCRTNKSSIYPSNAPITEVVSFWTWHQYAPTESLRTYTCMFCGMRPTEIGLGHAI